MNETKDDEKDLETLKREYRNMENNRKSREKKKWGVEDVVSLYCWSSSMSKISSGTENVDQLKCYDRKIITEQNRLRAFTNANGSTRCRMWVSKSP